MTKNKKKLKFWAVGGALGMLFYFILTFVQLKSPKIISILFYFFVGAVIGWIVEKMKRK